MTDTEETPLTVEIDTMTNPELPEEERALLARLAEDAINAVLRLEGYKGDAAEVSVLYTDDAFIAELNQQYRGIDGPTDVLSFALNEGEDDDVVKVPGAPDVLGDIVISLETARRQAGNAGKTAADEVALLLVHGTLHLLGYDHETPEKEAVMWKRQDEALKAIAGV